MYFLHILTRGDDSCAMKVAFIPSTSHVVIHAGFPPLQQDIWKVVILAITVYRNIISYAEQVTASCPADRYLALPWGMVIDE